MPTINDIAQKANVSVMTVSRALNKPELVKDKTLDRIRVVMDSLGYQPSHLARSLVRKKTNTIGIIMPDIKNTFFNSWFRFIEDYARQFNYNLLLGNTDDNAAHEMDVIRLLQSYRVDGILIVPYSEESVKYLINSKMNFILVDRMYKNLDVDFIATDHYAGAYKLTEYLIRRGHKKIAVLKGPGYIFPDVERYRGYCDAMKKHKIKISSSMVRNCELLEQNANDAVQKLIHGHERPTAIFSFNSLMTVGAIKAIQSAGLDIPGDISLGVFDEIPGSDIFKPKLTYVEQPVEELGIKATKILLKKIDNSVKNKRYKVFLQPELIPGDSCKNILRKNYKKLKKMKRNYYGKEII